MKNKKTSILIVALIIAISCCSFALFSCVPKVKEKKSNSVQIEVYHPQIEGKVVRGLGYWMKYDGKPKVFDVKIFSIDEKKYISNNDLVRKDLNSLIVVIIYKNDETNSTRIDISDTNSWPTEIGKYKISVNFNCFVVKKEDLDPNYKGTGSTFFDLFIEEEKINE